MKYEGDLEMVACPPHRRKRGPWRINHWGGVQDCVDFRTISLVSHASKIVKIVLKILARTDEDCEKNAGFYGSGINFFFAFLPSLYILFVFIFDEHVGYSLFTVYFSSFVCKIT